MHSLEMPPPLVVDHEDEAAGCGCEFFQGTYWTVACSVKRLFSCSTFINGIIISYVASNMSGYLFFFFFQCIASDPFFTGNNFVIIFRRYAVVLFIINLALGHLAGTTLNALANHQRPFLLDGSGRVVSRNDGVLAVAIQIVKAERLVDASLACAGMTTMCTHYYYVSVQNTLRRCDATESRTKPQQQKTNQTRCCLGYMPRQNIQKRQNNNNQTKKKNVPSSVVAWTKHILPCTTVVSQF
jgi:hypothetical protein